MGEIMFKVGDLVRYKKTAVDNDSIGLVVRQSTVFKQFWVIKWLNGLEYQDNEMNLEVVCK